MLIDLRYHLVSLVAVFLALAVGILVGSSFIAGSSVERQVAKGLEQQFSQIQAENRQQQATISHLMDRLKRNEEFERGTLPMLVDAQLSWRRVALVQTGDYTEAAQSAKLALETAGAAVVSVTTISNLSAQSAKERVNRAIELVTGESNAPDPVGRILEIVAECIATGSNADAMGVLEQKGLVATAGEYSRRVPTIVLVGGSRIRGDKRPQRMDLSLIEALKSARAVVVGCEPIGAITSYVPTYQKKAVPTVDNVDTPMGQIALVFAVREGAGNFGIKKSADRVLPSYFESGQWRYRYPR